MPSGASLRCVILGVAALSAALLSAEEVTDASFAFAWEAAAAPVHMAAAFRAGNPTQGFDVWIDPEEVLIQPPAGGWELRLSLTRVGREGSFGLAEVGALDARGSRIAVQRGSVVEWYENQSKGLEQGLTIHERAPGPESEVVIEFALKGTLVPCLVGDGAAVHFLSPGRRFAALVYRDLVVVDVAGRELASRIELEKPTAGAGTTLRLVVDDSGAEYPLTVDPLISATLWQSPDALPTTSLAWGDWDGDGDLDLAVGNSGLNQVFQNDDGDLGVVPAWQSPDLLPTSAVAWGDWDGDGDLDLAVGNFNEPNQVYQNDDGDLGVAPAWESSAGNTTFDLAWGDWDGDGDLDLAVGNYWAPNQVWQNSGGDLGVVPAWESPDFSTTYAVAWGDLDNDGDIDLAEGNWGDAAGVGSPNRVWRNSGGDLGVVPAWTSPLPLHDTRDVAWGDWDGDGDLDLVEGNWGSISIENPNLLWRNSGGDLGTAPVWNPGPNFSNGTQEVAWGDWDNDGDPDLASGNDLEVQGDQIRVRDNLHGSFAYLPEWNSQPPSHTSSVAWGDCDGDGDLDLASGNLWETNQVFANVTVPLSTETDWSSEIPTLGQEYMFGVAWGDWDGDGDLDLAAAGSGMKVWQNWGAGLSDLPFWDGFAGSGMARDVAWGDFDGDTDLDLAVARDDFNQVWENIGGWFGWTPVWQSSDSRPSASVAWGDWDGDGDLDLAVGNGDGTTGDVNQVWQNTGGNLGVAPVWQSSDSKDTQSVAWGDWDGDGDLDLAVGNSSSGDVNQVWENVDGDLGTGPAWESTGYQDRTQSVAWGDWDGDGDLDLAEGNLGQLNRVWPNSGGALGPTPVWQSTDAHPSAGVAWADWDGDGDLDLGVVGGPAVDQVWENTGGTLGAFPVWESPEDRQTYSLAWGDWNQDGDLDLGTGGLGTPETLFSSGVAANRVFSNTTTPMSDRLPENPLLPIVVGRPGFTPAASFHSVAECLNDPIVIDYCLRDREEDLAPELLMEYSLDTGGLNGGGTWHVATRGIGGDGTQGLAGSPDCRPYRFVWDATADGVTRADSVVFRVTVLYQSPTSVAYPIQRGSLSAVSPPFRICQPAADLGIEVWDGRDTVVPGQSVLYVVTVGNAGPDDVVGASVNDVIPVELVDVGWTCDDTGGGLCGAPSGTGDIEEIVDLPGGTHVEYTISATVGSGATGVLEHRAAVALPAGMKEIDESDNLAVDLKAIESSSDLGIVLTDGHDTAIPGETVVYQMTLTNLGPSNAAGAQVVFPLPDGILSMDWTCEALGGAACGAASGSGPISEAIDLPAGTTVTFTVDTDIDPGVTGTLVAVAWVLEGEEGDDGPRGDPDPMNNTDTDVDSLTPEADLTLTKDDGADTAVIGRQLSYTITALNQGPSTVHGSFVEDIFPPEITAESWTCEGLAGGICGAGGPGDIADAVDLPPAGMVIYTATGTVVKSDLGATITNTAIVTCPEDVFERNPTDNQATDVDLLLEVAFEDGFESGDISAWSATVPEK